MKRGMERGGTWVACGRFPYDSSKDSCDYSPRVLKPRTAPHKLTNFPIVVGSASSTETIQKPPRHNLDDDGASFSEQGEESAFNQPPEFLCGETPSCQLSFASQWAGVMRDGQGLPSVRLRGMISLVLSPVLVCPGFLLRVGSLRRHSDVQRTISSGGIPLHCK